MLADDSAWVQNTSNWHLKGWLLNGLANTRLMNAVGIAAGLGKIIDVKLSETQLKNLEAAFFPNQEDSLSERVTLNNIDFD